jgi:hypothetical protein
VVSGENGNEEWGVTAKYRVPSGSDKNVLELIVMFA